MAATIPPSILNGTVLAVQRNDQGLGKTVFLKRKSREKQSDHSHPLYTIMMRVVWRLARRSKYRGVDIGLFFCDVNGQLIAKKVCNALDLLVAASPNLLGRLQRDTRGILVMPLGDALGEFFPPLKLCCFDEKHVSNDSMLPQEIAALIVHEGTHAHLYAMGIGYPASLRVRIEKLCHRRELWFAKRIGSEALGVRAREYIGQPDSFWSAESQKLRWLNTLNEYEISGWAGRFMKYLIAKRFP